MEDHRPPRLAVDRRRADGQRRAGAARAPPGSARHSTALGRPQEAAGGIRDAGRRAIALTRRLLTVGHSYVVTQNRRLAHEIARASGGRWDVTVGAPQRLPGDLGPIALNVDPAEPCDVETLGMHLS